MVFFTCNHCGESVKKPAVEKHYNTKCRGAMKNISCMDCLKDFRGEEYVAHTKCITELQKYSGKDYVPKESKNSGAKKQESWMDTIRSILESSDYNLSGQARSAFQRLQSVDNVPRKKAKFQNFVANCMHMPKALSEEVWNVLEKEQEKMKLARQQESAAAKDALAKADSSTKMANGVKRETNGENTENEHTKKKSKKGKAEENGNALEQQEATATQNEAEEPAQKKSKKRKSEQNGSAEVQSEKLNGHNEPDGKKSKKQKETENKNEVEVKTNAAEITAEEEEESFQWSSALEKLVGKHSEGIELKKLKKRLLKKYVAKLGIEVLTEKQQKKFEKKFAKTLKKCPAIQVDGEVAKPC